MVGTSYQSVLEMASGHEWLQADRRVWSTSSRADRWWILPATRFSFCFRFELLEPHQHPTTSNNMSYRHVISRHASVKHSWSLFTAPGPQDGCCEEGTRETSQWPWIRCSAIEVHSESPLRHLFTPLRPKLLWPPEGSIGTGRPVWVLPYHVPIMLGFINLFTKES